MRRGKRFLENDNMFIYVGTAIFILLAIAIGIIMYMTTRTGVRIEGNVAREQQNTENVTSEIGKTVEEQKENIISNETKNEEIEIKENKKIETEQHTKAPVTPDEPDITTQAKEIKQTE